MTDNTQKKVIERLPHGQWSSTRAERGSGSRITRSVSTARTARRAAAKATRGTDMATVNRMVTKSCTNGKLVTKCKVG